MEISKLYMNAICSVGKLVNALDGKEHEEVLKAYETLLENYKKL